MSYMYGDVHVYTANWEPLTRHSDPISNRKHYINSRRVYRCHECRDSRWAKNLKVQVYYDHLYILCADGCYGENRK